MVITFWFLGSFGCSKCLTIHETIYVSMEREDKRCVESQSESSRLSEQQPHGGGINKPDLQPPRAPSLGEQFELPPTVEERRALYVDLMTKKHLPPSQRATSKQQKDWAEFLLDDDDAPTDECISRAIPRLIALEDKEEPPRNPDPTAYLPRIARQ